jgi:penicillin-binding protein 2
MGIDSMSKSLKSLGLGVKTGVDLPREYRGVIPDKNWKMKRFKQQWYKGETVIAAIGQGYDAVTPLQLARYTNLLATGKLVTPHFAKVINGVPILPEIKQVPLDPKVMETIHAGMYDVCNTPHGTAYRHLRKLPIVVAGKTGTSQVVSIAQNVVNRTKEHDLEYWKRSHALLTTYAPFGKPKYIVTTLVEHGGHGGGTNGPIVADIYKWMFERGYFSEENNLTQEAVEHNATTSGSEAQKRPQENEGEKNIIHLSDPQ